MVPASLGPSASSSGIEQAMRLTPDGERMARQLAKTNEDGQDALLLALLGE